MKVSVVCMGCDKVLRVEDWPDKEEVRGLTTAGLCVECRKYFDKHGKWPEKKPKA
jgi:hypothetical protein